jgi:hypothetical protein
MWLDDGQEYILTEMAQDFLNGDLPDMVMLSTTRECGSMRASISRLLR